MKQRLVGAIVLGCLAIIFIPMLLDGEGLSSPDLVIEVPVSPPLPDIPDNRPVRPDFALEEEARLNAGSDEEAADTEADDTSEPEEEVVAVDDIIEQPERDDQGLPRAWVVRLGIFGDRNNAEALEKRLLDLDYKAFIRPFASSEGDMNAVYVGPLLTRADANRLKTDLASRVEIEGVVREFDLDN